MDHEYYYNAAKSRYYNACSEISSCENRISTLQDQRQKKVNQINRLETEVKDNQEALDDIVLMLKSEEALNNKVTDISGKTSQASTAFVGMVHSSDVASKSLSDAYGDELTGTKRALSNALTNMRTKKNNLSAKVSGSQSDLRQAKSDLHDIDNSIKSTKSSLGDWRTTKKNASYDMEYHRRKMNEAA
ncbi:MAG: hypothetical protein LBD25_01980 [Coriobacteriales bacterium]|jgi:peptidoglycan hydrolase CwlO-like protein|nr:hypothetical protein [Coriobacteriales bacterium]